MFHMKHIKEVFTMDLETWVTDLFKGIQKSAEKGENYDLHLELPAVKEIADAYKSVDWIEIY